MGERRSEDGNWTTEPNAVTVYTQEMPTFTVENKQMLTLIGNIGEIHSAHIGHKQYWHLQGTLKK